MIEMMAKTRYKEITRLILLPVLCLSLISCQATNTPGEGSSEPSPTTGASGLTGQVFSASDVTGQPDTPLANQMVLAVKLDQAGEALGASSDQLSDQRLRFLKASLPSPSPALAVALSDADGNYSLSLDPGEYVLCAADSEKTPPDFPVTIRGCGRTVVREGQIRQVDISRGFGEIVLVEKD